MKFKVGDEVVIGHQAVEITVAGDCFGRTPHYGFVWNELTTGKLEQGWMPCVLMDLVGECVVSA